MSSETPSTRKLAAILFADIVGYTSLMQSDEAKALNSLSKFKKELNILVPNHQGEIIQFYGDGCLAIFNSSVDAVVCAKDLQAVFRTAPQVPVRIGMHAGDVVLKEDNVFGDAVNIASRIESMGIPESILLSDSVRKQIKSHTDFDLKAVGKFNFKNVEEPITIYALANKGLSVPKAEQLSGKLKSTVKSKATFPKWILPSVVVLLGIFGIYQWQASSKGNTAASSMASGEKSIAVLPFENLSANKENQFFCNGIMEDVLNSISKIKDLRVISNSTMERYRETEETPEEIAHELGVKYILTGKVQRYEDQVRIFTKLIDASRQEQMWSGKFDRTLTNIFDIQSEIAEKISNELQLNLNATEQLLIDYVPTENPLAYEYLQRGKNIFASKSYGWVDMRLKDCNDAIYYFEQAIDADPNLAEAYAQMGRFQIELHDRFGSSADILEIAKGNIEKALEMNPNLAIGYIHQARFYRRINDRKNWKKSLLKAYELNPNDLDVIRQLGNYYSGNFDYINAYKYLMAAYRIAPFNIRITRRLSNLYFYLQMKPEMRAIDSATLVFDSLNADRFNIVQHLHKINEATAQDVLDVVVQQLKHSTSEELWLLFSAGEYASYAGKFELAESYFRKVKKGIEAPDYNENLGSPPYRHRMAYALDNLGKKEEANFLLDDLIRFNKNIIEKTPGINAGERYDIACVYGYRGQVDSALFWLNDAMQNGSWFSYSWVVTDPMFEPIKKDPKFIEFTSNEKNRLDSIATLIRNIEFKN